MKERNYLLVQWTNRVLTPFGRIVVKKRLAMAKINHLILTLPNPTDKTIKDLNNIFYQFIWIGSIDRIKPVLVE